MKAPFQSGDVVTYIDGGKKVRTVKFCGLGQDVGYELWKNTMIVTYIEESGFDFAHSLRKATKLEQALK